MSTTTATAKKRTANPIGVLASEVTKSHTLMIDSQKRVARLAKELADAQAQLDERKNAHEIANTNLQAALNGGN